MTCSYKKLISKNNIENEIRLIEGSETDYIDNLGNIYKEVLPDQFYLKKNHINGHNGYTYCGISYPDGNKQRRVHVWWLRLLYLIPIIIKLQDIYIIINHVLIIESYIGLLLLKIQKELLMME